MPVSVILLELFGSPFAQLPGTPIDEPSPYVSYDSVYALLIIIIAIFLVIFAVFYILRERSLTIATFIGTASILVVLLGIIFLPGNMNTKLLGVLLVVATYFLFEQATD